MLNSVADFLNALRQSGRSVRTVDQYGWHLSRFAAFCAERGVGSPEGLDRALLREWGASLRGYWAASTMKVAVTAVRSFLRWLAEEWDAPDKLSSALKPPRVPKQVKRSLTAGEVQQLLQCCDQSPLGLRDAALVALMVDSGLRRREVVSLRVDALDLAEGVAPVERKGGNVGLAFFGRNTAVRLQLWLHVRAGIVRPGVPELFVAVGGSFPGEALTPEGLRSVLRHLGERAGVDHVHPHLFRHTMATLRLDAGDSSRTVQGVGGWSNLDLVEHYSAQLDLRRLARLHAPMDVLDPGIAVQLPLPL